MGLDALTLQLFNLTETLVRARQELSEIVREMQDTGDETRLAFAIKEIDIVRMTLLYEYELLDTGNIVEDMYLSSYHARRIEILYMTLAQVRNHEQELNGLSRDTEDLRAKQATQDATDVVVSAIHLLEQIVDKLEQGIIMAKEQRVVH